MLGMKSLAFILLLSTTICSQATPGNGFRINPILEGLFPEGELLSEQDTRFRMVKRLAPELGVVRPRASSAPGRLWGAETAGLRTRGECETRHKVVAALLAPQLGGPSRCGSAVPDSLNLAA